MRKQYLRLSLSSIFIFCFFSYANATMIQYNITGGVDTVGNNFSGYVYLNDTVIIGTNSDGYIDSIAYSIGSYEFKSSGGIAYGDSGGIGFMVAGPESLFPGLVVTSFGWASFEHTYIENYLGLQNLSGWVNGLDGVYFVGSELTVGGYSTLPQEIAINAKEMANGSGYIEGPCWGPSPLSGSQIVLTRSEPQPVPEPTSLFLLGSGLFTLVGFRKTMRK